MSNHRDIIIVGAGISGLATAWWLTRAGMDVLVFEQGSHTGGTMRTVEEDGWLVDVGPNSALETTPLFKELFSDLKIADEVVYANEAADRRYILRDGQLHALPMSLGAFLRSNLWSWKGKFRLLKELFVGGIDKEETVAEFVTRRLGSEFLDYTINPFVAGVFAGNPSKLSVQAAFPKLYALEKKYGGLIKGQILGARERRNRPEQRKDRARMFSFRQGMQFFPESIAKRLSQNVRTEFTVDRISTIHAENGSSARYQISGRERNSVVNFTASTLIIAIPSYSVAGLIESLDSTLGSSLRNIYYPPVAEVFLGFKREQIGHLLDGFGFLVPEKEQRKILGTIWSSTIFPHRSPEGCVALTTFVGGSRQPELLQHEDSKLMEMVCDDLKSIMKVNGKPVYNKISRWERAIPQYEVGHLSIIDSIEKFEARHPGLFLTGNYRGGISVGDCIMSSRVVADRARQFLEDTNQLNSRMILKTIANN